MMPDNRLRVSECFHSVQGEGNTMGKPSVFLRLQGCNLMCGGQGTEKDKELHNNATWRCDTIEVWLKGQAHNPQEYAVELADNYGNEFRDGSQLVITGGEPMLQQKQLVPMIHLLQSGYKKQLRIEVETNGTVELFPGFLPLVNQFNVSPKLNNSGMPVERRIKDQPLTHLSALSEMDRAIFKFVVTKEDDISEIFQDYIDVFGIPRRNVWLMPGCSTREEFEKVSPLVAESCKKYGFNFSSRLQINLWNETTGV